MKRAQKEKQAAGGTQREVAAAGLGPGRGEAPPSTQNLHMISSPEQVRDLLAAHATCTRMRILPPSCVMLFSGGVRWTSPRASRPADCGAANSMQSSSLARSLSLFLERSRLPAGTKLRGREKADRGYGQQQQARFKESARRTTGLQAAWRP